MWSQYDVVNKVLGYHGGDENSYNFNFVFCASSKVIGTTQEKEYLTSEGDIGILQAVSLLM